MRRLVLASASPARRYLLESAGLKPEVEVSHVDEDGTDHLPADQAVAVLAERKARAVARRLAGADPPRLIIGCDSILELDGSSWSKPSSPAEVVERWSRMRGRTGRLHTGHALIDGASSELVSETDTAVVRFGQPTDREIEAYSRTPEALQVAGPFTLEGHSAPWIESIDGNYGTITGLSLPVLRRLLGRVGVEIVDLWT
jgi:septum formation protein